MRRLDWVWKDAVDMADERKWGVERFGRVARRMERLGICEDETNPGPAKPG
jgi:hypothetical protein